MHRKQKPGQGRAGQGRAGQGRAGQGRAGQGRAGQGRAGQGRAGQGRAGQGRAGQGRGQGIWLYNLYWWICVYESISLIIVAWLDASQRSRDGVRLNRSASEEGVTWTDKFRVRDTVYNNLYICLYRNSEANNGATLWTLIQPISSGLDYSADERWRHCLSFSLYSGQTSSRDKRCNCNIS